MINLSLIDKLQKQANVSFEDAKEALEMTEWDVLDAYVWLQARGKIDSLPMESELRVNEKKEEEKNMESNQNTVNTARQEEEDLGFFGNLLQMLRQNRLVARASRGRVWSISLLGLLFVLLFFRKFFFVALIISLLLQVKYSIEGPDAKKKANNAQ
ncbi:MAG: hypothetical protein IJO67_00855 [Clostridia bacterium]|nr:hypothetical protein [Clostridia bacterium]